MDYKQLKAPNLKVAGQSGYCLVYARNVFGVASKYPTAEAAWDAAAFKHTDALPTKVAVPVWFSWGEFGHVAVSVPGKGFYTTTKQGVKSFASIDALVKYIGGGIKYLGWSEDINNVRVAQPVPPPAPPVSNMPPVGSTIQLIPPQTRTTWKPGTATKAGSIKVTDNTYKYTIRGHDTKFPGRVLINSKSGGGNGIGLALYYVSGALIEGWRRV